MKRKNQQGQSLLEFAIMVLALFAITIGIFDLGRAFLTKLVVANASREGARYLVLHPIDNTTGYTGTRDAIDREAENSPIDLSGASVSYECTDAEFPDDGCDSDTTVGVTVTMDFDFIFSGYFGMSSIPLTHTTRMYLP